MKFQIPNTLHSKVNRRTHKHKPKAICLSNFFLVGGIKSPSIGADEALGPFLFQNNKYTVHTSFSLQMTL